MGVEVVVAQVPIPDTTLIAELHMLDTSGSDLYKESLPQYWSGVYFAMIVFDITNAESFDSCRQWNEELKKNRWVEMLMLLLLLKIDSPSSCLTYHGDDVINIVTGKTRRGRSRRFS